MLPEGAGFHSALRRVKLERMCVRKIMIYAELASGVTLSMIVSGILKLTVC